MNNSNKLLGCICLGLIMFSEAAAAVTPGSMIADNMILPQNAAARIYGTADPGAVICVTPSWNNQSYTTTADSNGRWRLTVDTPMGGYKPYSITISDGDPVVINNVLIGEVWLAAGQSNMEMPLKGFSDACVEGAYDEISAASTRADRIRVYTVPLAQSYEPVETVNARWTVPSPETAPDYSATGWYFAKQLNDVLDVPVGLVRCAYGGAKVESWTPREILETYPDVSLDPAVIENMTSYHRPMLMYNAMFNPISDYSYNGIIWYQGCSNVGHHDDYPARLANMVSHWRDVLDCGELPFYTVEIAPYDYNSPDGRSWAPLLREAQWRAVEMIPNSGIICTNDLVYPYERYNIHPSNKAAVGKRLGQLALNKTYGKTMFPVNSPRYKSIEIRDGRAVVTLDVRDGTMCRDMDIDGFEVAGADRIFHKADRVKLNRWQKEIEISSNEVPEPVAVRYCWRDFQPGNFYGPNYLPLVPFRTDDWE